MAETQSSVKEVKPDIGGNIALDKEVIEVLPPGSRVLEASSFGSPAWTRTARIEVQLADGSSKQYFLKVESLATTWQWTYRLADNRFQCATEGGEVMMEGEFNSMSELHQLAPSFVPQPHAWGKFHLADPVTHFFLCDFIDMETEMPDTANGRVLKPSLVHGDLWEENAAINLSTGEPVVFDASAFYAHNEYELGTWRRETIKFSRSHFNQYRRNIPPSEPIEQWDDRIKLYSLKFNLAHMIDGQGHHSYGKSMYRCSVCSIDAR
ncbi:MAG: hypothetical protein Q9226_001474 [Calogaya cf. arnoldii]